MYTHLYTFKIFCSVVEKGSILKAAEDLFLSQPAVSLQIKNLESLYDTKFFDRTPRGLKVNEQGTVLYGYAKKLIEFHSEMYHNILRYAHPEKSELRIASSTVPGIYFFPKILRWYKEKYSTKFHFEVSDTNKILGQLIEGNIDIGVVSHTVNTKDLVYKKLWNHPLVLVFPKGYLKVEQPLRLKDLKGKDIILMKDGCDITKAWKSFLERYHVQQESFHPAAIFDHISSIIGLLKEFPSFSILPECMITKEIQNGILKKVKLKESGLQINFYLAFKPSNLKNTSIWHFYKFLKSFPLEEIKK